MVEMSGGMAARVREMEADDGGGFRGGGGCGGGFEGGGGAKTNTLLAVTTTQTHPVVFSIKTNAPLVVAGGVAVTMVEQYRGDGGDEWWRWRRVVASGVVDLIDREEGNVFGVRRKSSSEKFFDGDGGWPMPAGVG
nr:hypothetical protein [Tanacetum cinerariifolium]